MLELCRVATEEGEAKEEGEASCLDYAMARIDERSMSRASNSFECKEIEDNVKTKDEIQRF